MSTNRRAAAKLRVSKNSPTPLPYLPAFADTRLVSSIPQNGAVALFFVRINFQRERVSLAVTTVTATTVAITTGAATYDRNNLWSQQPVVTTTE
jgi:hypothetical protein